MRKFLIFLLLSVSFGAFTLESSAMTAKQTLQQVNNLVHKEPETAKRLIESINTAELTEADTQLLSYLSSFLVATSGQLDKAITMLLPLTDRNSELNIQIRAHSLLLLIYAGVHDWEHGLSTLSVLTEIIENSPEHDLVEPAYSNIVNFYNLLGEHEIAKQLADNVIDSFDSNGTKCALYSQQVYADLKLSSEKLNEQMFIEVINYCKATNSIFITHGTYTYLAEFLITQKRYLDAEKILLDNLEEVEKTGYHTMTATFYATLAEIKLLNNQFDQAELYAKRIIISEDQHQSAESISTAYKVLSKTAEKKQLYEQAFNYYKKYSETNQIEIDQNKAKLLAIQKAKVDAVKKNTQITLLDKENMLLKTQALLDNESAQNKRLALALLTMVLVMFVLWTYKNRRNYLRMQHYAQTDELTGIANRHYFTQQASTAIKYCKRTDQPVSFIMFDLDYFKRINDTYGHQAGDVALKIAVDSAKSACRKNDIVGRLGGEEFGVLLPGCASHLASFIAEKCRKAIETADFTSSGHDLDVTASFGIADSSNCEYDFEKLFAGADFALYQSKDMGRNRVVQYQKETSSFHI
jgi:diguanylate cyclase (GGDEF)-like protein